MEKISYNNYNDIYSANISQTLPKYRTVIVKHANPCGGR